MQAIKKATKLQLLPVQGDSKEGLSLYCMKYKLVVGLCLFFDLQVLYCTIQKINKAIKIQL